MDSQGIPAAAIVATIVIVISLFFTIRWLKATLTPRTPDQQDTPTVVTVRSELKELSDFVASSLPSSIILPQDDRGLFQQLSSDYWAQQEQESKPGCIVRPSDSEELSVLIKILKRHYDDHHEKNLTKTPNNGGLFAVRGGGHSPVAGAASIKGGIQIDLSLFRQITLSKDKLSVVVGAGCKWGEVSKVLDQRGVAVVGGRNADVGVAGLTLGGGVSYFTPGHGLVCSNVLSYEIILADGSIVVASESSHADLWRALKGGSNNFGIVTNFTFRCVSLPSSCKIWGGFLYMPWFEASRVLAAFHADVKGPDVGGANPTRDPHAVGPLLSFSYVPQLGFDIIAANLVHTDPPSSEKAWPSCWKLSPFSSLWRFWSTCKVQSLTSAIGELAMLNPPGRRQIFGTTTIKNDMDTIKAVHKAYTNTFTSMKKAKIKGLVWTFVLQPLLPDWSRKGDPDPLGLDHNAGEPLVIVSFSVNWDLPTGDEFVRRTAREALEKMDAAAEAHGTGHPFRYLNYCADWQKPFESYGKGNHKFLKEVSKQYDPDGLFQQGCTGGFKLGRDDLA